MILAAILSYMAKFNFAEAHELKEYAQGYCHRVVTVEEIFNQMQKLVEKGILVQSSSRRIYQLVDKL